MSGSLVNRPRPGGMPATAGGGGNATGGPTDGAEGANNGAGVRPK